MAGKPKGRKAAPKTKTTAKKAKAKKATAKKATAKKKGSPPKAKAQPAAKAKSKESKPHRTVEIVSQPTRPDVPDAAASVATAPQPVATAAQPVADDPMDDVGEPPREPVSTVGQDEEE